MDKKLILDNLSEYLRSKDSKLIISRDFDNSLIIQSNKFWSINVGISTRGVIFEKGSWISDPEEIADIADPDSYEKLYDYVLKRKL